MTPTDTQIREAAEAAAGMIGQGGFLLYLADDLSGGAWYSHESRPNYDPTKAIRVAIPNRGIRGSELAIDAIESAIRLSLTCADEYEPIFRHRPPREGDKIIGWLL